MAAYVTYNYYAATYKGAAIAQSDFDRLALRASALIDQMTFARAASIVAADEDDDTIDKIKMATCAVAEEIQAISEQGGGAVMSERVGNVSVTYADTSRKSMSDAARYADAARVYLAPTDLLYRGVYDVD
jgi:hypothetical protein